MRTPPRNSTPAGRPHAVARAAPLLLACLLLTGCASSHPRREKTRRGNLAEGALLLTMYAHNHKGRYPDDFRLLGEINPFYSELLCDPETGKPFIYLGKGLTIRDADKPLLVAPDPAGARGSAVTVEGDLIQVKLSDVLLERTSTAK